MISNILIGISYALSAGLQPGPLQAFFLSKVAQNGWRKTLPAAFAPLLSDGPIALVSILLLNNLPPTFRDWLQVAGGILLLYFAWSTFRRREQAGITDEESSKGSQPKTVGQAALINLFNPNPYLGWSLVMGPAVLTAWSAGPEYAIFLLLAFYLTMISTSMVMIYLMGRALLLGPNAGRMLSTISALLLVILGLYFLYQAAGHLSGWLG